MSIGRSMLPEFDQEMAGVRKTLERVPDDRFDWKPHEKSTPMGDLATHLSNLPTWASLMMDTEEFDIAPPGVGPLKAERLSSAEALVAKFDENVAAARAALEGVSDERVLAPWALLKGGERIFALPRVACLRSFVINHMIHHRAQLGVYLRLVDVPVPSIYGPSADESPF
jgi:uncharacterized damage-inducible protein DinB